MWRIHKKSLERRENEELIARYFAYIDNNNYLNASHDVADFIDAYVKANIDASEEHIKSLENEFYGMLEFTEKTFPYGFRKSLKSQSTPRVRFEALSVGITLGLRINPNLYVEDTDWTNEKMFMEHTTTHASNNPGRLKERVEYVRNELIRNNIND